MASKKEQRDERVEELKKSVEDLKEPVKAFTERVKKTVGNEAKSIAEDAKALGKEAKKQSEKVKKSVEKAGKTVKSRAKKVSDTLSDKESEVKVFVEYGEKQLSTEDLVARAKEAYLGANPLAEIKTLELYVKPEEGAAYYVVNGEASPEFKLVF